MDRDTSTDLTYTVHIGVQRGWDGIRRPEKSSPLQGLEETPSEGAVNLVLREIVRAVTPDLSAPPQVANRKTPALGCRISLETRPGPEGGE